MQDPTRGSYKITRREIVAEGSKRPGQVLNFGAGECIPWPYHSEIADSFFCMEGPMVVETRAPRAEYVLVPGQTCSVGPQTAHYVHGKNDGPCKFMIVQGVGVYDFVPVG